MFLGTNLRNLGDSNILKITGWGLCWVLASLFEIARSKPFWIPSPAGRYGLEMARKVPSSLVRETLGLLVFGNIEEIQPGHPQ
jgi:hypothetical protein